MSKLANPQHEAWFQSVGKTLNVVEQADETAKQDYQQFAKNLTGQFKRALPMDESKKLARLIRSADKHATDEKFAEAKITLDLASRMALTLIQTAYTLAGEQNEAQGSEEASAEQGKQQLAGKAKGAHYKDEEKKFGWRKDADPNTPFTRESPVYTTRHETTEEERQKSAKHVTEDGRLVQRQAVDPNVASGSDSSSDDDDRPTFVEKGMADGQLGYVIDPATGQMHTFNQTEIEYEFVDGQKVMIDRNDPKKLEEMLKKHGNVRRIKAPHHTTPLAGADVAGAGDVVTEDSRIREITDASGHYKPGEKQTLQTVKHLDEQGALVDERSPREVLEERLAKLDAAYDAATRDESLVIMASMRKLKAQLDDLQASGDDDANQPMHHEAKVKLIGKVGLTDEECIAAKGDVDKIYKIVVAKAKKELSFDVESHAATRDAVLDTIAKCATNPGAMNLMLGSLFAKTMSKSQYLQTGGNERQARSKEQLGKEIESKQGPKFQQEETKRQDWLEAEIQKLGGKEKVREFGVDPNQLQLQTIYDMLTGAINTTTPAERKAAKLAKQQSKQAEQESSSSESEQDASSQSYEDSSGQSYDSDASDESNEQSAEEGPSKEELQEIFDQLGGHNELISRITKECGDVPDYTDAYIRQWSPLPEKIAVLKGEKSIWEFTSDARNNSI